MNKITNRKPNILFYRDFKGFTGGHLKVWDYYQHVKSYADFDAKIYFSEASVWTKNPWLAVKNENKLLTKWIPSDSDVLFLAGMDWLSLAEQDRQQPPSPVINLIQHVRHADKNNPLYDFLKYPATRICVSQEVADAISATGQVNGSIVVNPNGIEHSLFPPPLMLDDKDISFLIIGLKEPLLAKQVSKQLSTLGIQSHLVIDHLQRKDFLSLINRAKTVLFLPNKTEGFYLPALEAMYLKALVICPDCVGNRGFCIDSITCFAPSYITDDIVLAVKNSLLIDSKKRAVLVNKAYEHANTSTLQKERKKFLDTLCSLDKGGCKSMRYKLFFSKWFKR